MSIVSVKPNIPHKASCPALSSHEHLLTYSFPPHSPTMFASEFESEYDSDEVETMDEDDEDDEDDADDAHDANDANDAYNAHCAADVNRHQEKKSKIEFSRYL